MGQLINWQNVPVPDLRAKQEGIRTAADLLGRAGDSATAGVEAFQEGQTNAADKAILARALGIQDPEEYARQRAAGQIVGPDAANASIEALGAVEARTDYLGDRANKAEDRTNARIDLDFKRADAAQARQDDEFARTRMHKNIANWDTNEPLVRQADELAMRGDRQKALDILNKLDLTTENRQTAVDRLDKLFYERPQASLAEKAHWAKEKERREILTHTDAVRSLKHDAQAVQRYFKTEVPAHQRTLVRNQLEPMEQALFDAPDAYETGQPSAAKEASSQNRLAFADAQKNGKPLSEAYPHLKGIEMFDGALPGDLKFEDVEPLILGRSSASPAPNYKMELDAVIPTFEASLEKSLSPAGHALARARENPNNHNAPMIAKELLEGPTSIPGLSKAFNDEAGPIAKMIAAIQKLDPSGTMTPGQAGEFLRLSTRGEQLTDWVRDWGDDSAFDKDTQIALAEQIVAQKGGLAEYENSQKLHTRMQGHKADYDQAQQLVRKYEAEIAQARTPEDRRVAERGLMRFLKKAEKASKGLGTSIGEIQAAIKKMPVAPAKEFEPPSATKSAYTEPTLDDLLKDVRRHDGS